MRRSESRILTSHTGSLHRPTEFEKVADRHFDLSSPPEQDWDPRLQDEVVGVVGTQRDLGIDLVNDGEYSKPNWLFYAAARLSGFGESRQQAPAFSSGLGSGSDIANFPLFYGDAAELDGVAIWRRHSESFFPNPDAPLKLQACVGPITYTGHDAVAADVANLTGALDAAGIDRGDGFIGVAAPGTFASVFADEHYGDRQEYLFAVADAIGAECRAITDAGLMVQIDDPALASITDLLGVDSHEAREVGEIMVAATNRALEGIPPEKVRFHICWGSWNSPHVSDPELADVIDLVYSVNAGLYSIEASNARHDHEWRVFRDHPLPEGKIVMPGVVCHATNVVEHPQGVADRIVRYAEIVGRENVVAGSDCGFRARSHPEVAWAKLRSLSAGAELASAHLWR